MPKYNVGDTLSGYAPPIGRATGKFTGELSAGRHPRVETPSGRKLFLHAGSPITVTGAEPAPAPFAFVGKRPEPAELPGAVLPFKLTSSGAGIADDEGRYVLGVAGDVLDDAEDKALAALVVKLLNVHFGVE